MADNENVFIEGRSRDKAIALLAAAKEAGHPLDVVRTTRNGYTAPADVAKIYEDGVDYEPADIVGTPAPTGEVAPDSGNQTEAEKAAAEAEGEAESDVTAESEAETEAETEVAAVEEPAKNASTEKWAEYAATKGYDTERGLTRDELIAEYGQN